MDMHDGAPAQFKVLVLSQHKDPMSRVIQEAMNIKNYQDKGLNCLNSKAEYRQAPIVRTTSWPYFRVKLSCVCLMFA